MRGEMIEFFIIKQIKKPRYYLLSMKHSYKNNVAFLSFFVVMYEPWIKLKAVQGQMSKIFVSQYSFNPRVEEFINKMKNLRQKYEMETDKSRNSGNGTEKKKEEVF